MCEYLHSIHPEYILNLAGRNQHEWFPIGTEHPIYARSWMSSMTEEDRAIHMMALAFNMPMWLKEDGYPDHNFSATMNVILGNHHDIICSQDLERLDLGHLEFDHSLILSFGEFDIWAVLTTTAFFSA